MEQLDSANSPLAVDRLYVTVIANFVAMALGEPPALVVYSPLLPLFLLLFSGLYMFALPYLGRSSERAAGR